MQQDTWSTIGVPRKIEQTCCIFELFADNNFLLKK